MEVNIASGIVAAALFTSGVLVGASFHSLYVSVALWEIDRRKWDRERAGLEALPPSVARGALASIVYGTLVGIVGLAGGAALIAMTLWWTAP